MTKRRNNSKAVVIYKPPGQVARRKRARRILRAPKAANSNKAIKSEVEELRNLVKDIAISQKASGGSNWSFLNGNSLNLSVPKIFGMGAYSMSNSMWDTAQQVPVMHSTNESIRFRHREYLCDIIGSTSFAINSFNINPGLATAFPYLSAIAQNFQEYRFRGLVVEFKSTSADALNSTNTALGTVSLVAQYRADLSAPVSKQELLNQMWSVDTKPSCNALLPIECAPKENPIKQQYIRTGNLAANQDIKFYDLCKVFVATSGMQAAATIGELWISYDVELYKPDQVYGSSSAVLSAHYGLLSVTNGASFGTGRTALIDTIGLTFTSTTITFPANISGYFLVTYTAGGAATAVTDPTVTYTNCSVPTLSGGIRAFGMSGLTVTTYSYWSIVYIPPTNAFGVQAVITYTGGTLPATLTSADLYVSQFTGTLS